MFDGELMRGIHADILYLGIVAVFALQWIELYSFILAYDGAYKKAMFWVGLIVYFSVTLIEMLVQLLFIPKIDKWSESASVKDNDVEKKNLLAF